MFKDKSDIKILFFGPKGSYTDIAKDKFIEKFSINNFVEIPKHTITALLKEIDEAKDSNTFAVIPIENSIEGMVRETADNLARLQDKSVKILAEVVLPISHCLVTYAKSFKDIKTVLSYPQGLAQCREFISANMVDDVFFKTATSTSQAVREITFDDNTIAAIASEKAAQIYNVPVLAREINDEKDNMTRFVLIGRADTPRTGNDRTSISFTTENKPGALNKVLNILDKYNINMTYIYSRPSKRFLGEYTFYIDFDGHIKNEEVAKALFEILQHTKLFRHIGSYEKF